MNFPRKHKTNNGANTNSNGVSSAPMIMLGAKTPEALTNRISNPVKKAFAGSRFVNIDSWLGALAGTEFPASQRAKDPFGNHAWVFSAAIAIAQTASQAHYTLYLETDEAQEARAIQARKVNGGKWNGPQRGSRRKAIARYLLKSVNQRLVEKGLEPITDLPFIDTLLQPNPFLSGSQFFQLLYTWLSVRGEVFIVKAMEDGGAVPPGQLPERLWPLSPDLFEPILAHQSYGQLVGWYFYPPAFLRDKATSVRIPLSLDDVIQIKYPDPDNPLRGLSRISAVAMGIRLDMMIKEFNKAILQNGGDPGGIITYDGVMTPEERTDYLSRWEQDNQGTENARRTELLEGGFKYTPLGLSPQDMQHLESQRWDREEVLASMQVPPSILGITEKVPYNTQQGQIALFWDKTLLPMLNLVEQSLDQGLLAPLPDNIVGAFELRNIEALRFGLAEKVKIADQMTGTNLHMPPVTAYEVLNMEIPEYADDDKTAHPVTDLESSSSDEELPSSEPGDNTVGKASSEVDSIPPVHGELEAREKELKERLKAVLKERVDDFIEMEEPHEEAFGKSYKSWAKSEKTLALEAFDDAMKALFPGAWLRQVPSTKQQSVSELIASFPDILDSQNALKDKVRPNYATQLEAVYDFTVIEDFGGVPVFEIDDPKILEFWNAREQKFVTTTPVNIRNNLVTSLSEGWNAGETVQELRQRVAGVYDLAAGDPKTLQVARTETGGFMNGERNEMFGLQGIETEFWSTAGDEHVRDTHKQYGNEDEHPRGFNYLTVSEKSGKGELRYPGDVKCTDASEVVNCRCIKVPAG